uniref:NADH dehydrogenase subunit 6 n=1 Tax=Eucinostomus gula TaxID=435273 RepID=UPI0028FCE1D5|nr:NADH dehydrogenase subunit 6 [Eucinostomus gula]WNH21463.1 NADH dehydrogenase subunit 6 [Eucinostomus gula]WNH37975.1 NADH dehydrogenase subunit 6 [Eucinostomus gula]
MSFITFVFLFGSLGGLLGVAANPSPFFAALGLVVAAGMGCGVLAMHGGSFLSLVLFLIYLGGMLVVFAYSAALAADRYPEGYGSLPVVLQMLGYLLVVSLAAGVFWGGWYEASWSPVEEGGDFHLLRGELGGVGMVYGPGGGTLIIGAWVLLLTLFVVLELTRGLSRGSLRAV